LRSTKSAEGMSTHNFIGIKQSTIEVKGQNFILHSD
jgi:hypothetical protein